MITVSIVYFYLPESCDVFGIANDNSLKNGLLGSQKFILDHINRLSFPVRGSVIIFQGNLDHQQHREGLGWTLGNISLLRG